MRLFAMLLLMTAPPAAAAQDSAAPARDSPAQALERVADALGGSDRIRGLRSLRWDAEGDLFWLNQGPTPERPMELDLRQRHFADLAARLTYVSFDFSGPESSFQRGTAIRQDSNSETLLELTALSPVAVVRELLEQPADLEATGRADGVTRIVGRVMGRAVEIETGPDGLPRALRYQIVDDLFGNATRQFEYLGYRRQGGWAVPTRIRQTDAGRLALDTASTDFAANGERPDWAAGLAPRPAHPAESPGALAAEQLAPRIHFLRRHGGQDYHGLAVELDEGWMVLETPGAIGDGSELREVLAALSAKPIIYAVPTHHHDDHAAGIGGLAGDGLNVLTTPGNVDYFTTMTRAPRRSTAHASVRIRALVQGERIGPVQFFDIGPTAHVAEMLVFYLPEQRILFHSDMGRFNDDGSVEPARPQTCALLAFIEDRGLAVDRIVSGHGRPGTLDDLRRSIAMRDAPCPG